MSRRKTVSLNMEFTTAKIKEVFRHNVIFCEKMERAHNWVTDWNRKDENGNPKPKNLPSPEEATKMCALLGVEPGEILTEQSDIDLVTELLAQEREKRAKKERPADSETLSAAKKKLLEAVDGLPDEQLEKLLGLIEEAKKLL